METALAWKNQDLEVLRTATTNQDREAASAPNVSARLHALAVQLLHEVQCIGDSCSIDDVTVRSLESGLDFYDEVRRFEIDLIKRALRQTAGHQSRAAKLLKLKVSTLNAKIKHYDLHPLEFANGHVLIRSGESVPGQFA